ncbi:hypothetical protein D3C85_1515030 [compost metagenome]
MQSLRFQECLLKPPFMGGDDNLLEEFDFLRSLGACALKQAQLNAAIKQLVDASVMARLGRIVDC